jgi:hypothetical protein
MTEPKTASLETSHAEGCDVSEIAAAPHEHGDVTVCRPGGRNDPLRRRYRAAIGLLADCQTAGERIDLLAAIVWPQDDRLRAA